MVERQLARLHKSQKSHAAAVLARAFHDDPMYRYVFPDPDDRARCLPLLWNGLLTYGLRYGEVTTTPDVAGVALWLAPGNTTVTGWRLLRTGFPMPRAVMRFKADDRRRMMPLVGEVERRHKAITCPHWYLWVLGVDPDHQGQGIGSALIAPVLARADAAQVACYLETGTEANVAYYERRDFVVRESWQVEGSELRLWTMLREPRT